MTHRDRGELEHTLCGKKTCLCVCEDLVDNELIVDEVVVINKDPYSTRPFQVDFLHSRRHLQILLPLVPPSLVLLTQHSV